MSRILVFILSPSPDVISDMIMEPGIMLRAICLEDDGVDFRQSYYGGDDLECAQDCEEICKLSGLRVSQWL